MPVLIRGALALLLRDVEVGKADERGENIEKDARAQPPLAAAEANPVYPVPVVYDQARFRRVLERLRA